ncbi:MAG: hypothetical protein ACKVJX_25080, partial [Verrucomicrobiia bacterium]
SSIENNTWGRVARLLRTGGIDTGFLNNLSGANNTIHAMAVQHNADAGTFTLNSSLAVPGGAPLAVATANLNPSLVAGDGGDNLDDIVVATAANTIEVYYKNPLGGFVLVNTLTAGISD